jgi:5-(carboxyamino)imidazole ribonucleotide synthase
VSPATAPTAPATGCSARVAMVGPGQLARMTQQAAIALDVELRVLTGAEDEPAVLAGAVPVVGSPARLEDLRALAAGADVVTFDHEGIAPELLAELEGEGVRLAPRPAAKLLAQDKLVARRELAAMGFPIPPFTAAERVADAEAFAAEHGWPLVAKSPRGGYDGRGVFPLHDRREAERVLSDGGPVVVEPHLALERELAVLVARSPRGETRAYPVVETVQRGAMCREILAPAPVPEALAARATELAVAVAERIGATGVLAVELFVTADGLLVNELALRPHNSGHYTIEGCVTSQFEQHLRAVLDWPLGAPDLLAPSVATVNVVGPADGADPRDRLPAALAVPGAHVHLYGKGSRPGRKLGHVTVVGEDAEATRAAARRAAALLEGAAE